jgi:NADH-quinone oxidoreductase subunit D
MMTELNRMSSHLVALATNGMDIGALSMMLYGFREREMILAFFEKVTGLRMNHNYIRPGAWPPICLPGGGPRCDRHLRHDPRAPGRLFGPPRQQPDLAGADPRGGGDHRRGVQRLQHHRPHPASGRGALGHPQGVSLLRHRAVRVRHPHGEHGDVYDRYRVRMDEIAESIRIVRQVVDSMPKGDYRVDDRKITPPPRARIDESMEALIHHFKIFTEGFKVPPGETYMAVESPRGELGCYIVSNGEGKPWKMHTRAPSFYNLQALRS